MQRMNEDLPGEKGSYLLIFSNFEERYIEVSKIGIVHFPAGRYVYAGSACGPGGLRSRVSRHLKIKKKNHWHLDWVRPHFNFEGVFFELASGKECIWSQKISSIEKVEIPQKRFGAADCINRCPAHFFWLPEEITFDYLVECLSSGTVSPEHGLKKYGKIKA